MATLNHDIHVHSHQRAFPSLAPVAVVGAARSWINVARRCVTAPGGGHLGVVAGVIATCLVASCTMPHVVGTHRAMSPDAPATPTTTSTTSTPSAASTSTSTTSSPSPEQPGWTVVSFGPSGVAVDQRSLTVPDGQAVIVTRFRSGQVSFNLHVGSQDPPIGNAIIGPESGPQVAASERPMLLAAFNGGFKQAAGAGGCEVNQQVLSPLVGGMASLVIDTNGTAHVGAWGEDVPLPMEQVASVRQNLAPLVIDAQPSPNINIIGSWGATLGGVAAVARSALGEDPQGDILYAAAMQALPVDLADALIAAGATSAMQLDINPGIGPIGPGGHRRWSSSCGGARAKPAGRSILGRLDT